MPKINDLERLKSEKKGITVAGNLIVDFVKKIDSFPQKQMLSGISSVSRAVGGCVPNTAIGLRAIDPSIPVRAAGKVGKDESGAFIVNELQKRGIDTSLVLKSDLPTSFSDVMTEEKSGERTFFHYRGANAEFSPEDLAAKDLGTSMLHIGYVLLLDLFDRENAEYGTEMARALCEAKSAGIKTSIDAVSDNKGGFARKLFPALRYTDNVIVNEIEACGAAGLPARGANGALIPENVRASAEKLMAAGVGERVIVHCPEAGFLLHRGGDFTVVPSLALPKGFIKGSVGAGDAFCAGCLYGIYRGLSDGEILEFASGAAAACLSEEDSIGGMRSIEKIKELIGALPKRRVG